MNRGRRKGEGRGSAPEHGSCRSEGVCEAARASEHCYATPVATWVGWTGVHGTRRTTAGLLRFRGHWTLDAADTALGGSQPATYRIDDHSRNRVQDDIPHGR